ncbi:pseudouridine synthase [Verrucomicrobia bacterium IMCC26134]|jgi:23S rRNA pseudouridine1911/1915/1917 synthase|nr:pseudouridine synthase [Verrucomicrobia bacterium IMCC26134]
MSLPQTYTVPDTIRRERADKVLAAAFPELSRVAWQRSFDAGLVRRAGIVLDKKHDLHAGEVIEFAHADVVPSELHASGTRLDILFEDAHMLAVNKPAGMVVHPGAGTKDNTLVHALLGHCAGTLSGIGGVERPGIVHRLDRDTTGVMLVAKSDAAHRALSEQFAGRNLHKEYLALVSGVPRLLSGTLDGAIARNKIHRHRMAVTEDGKPARTDWKREQAFIPLAALMRCHILTGRTHQIRIHMKTAGHPLLGDVTYGWKDYGKLPIKPERVMLHSEMIRFTHPITGEQMEVHAPLPEDFKAMIAALRIAADAAKPKLKGIA